MMSQKEQIKQIIEILSPKPCIVVTQRYEYDRNGNRIPYGLTVIGESSERIGQSRGVHTRYDYGFMQLDVQAGIAVVVM